jgi:hypothetical protein
VTCQVNFDLTEAAVQNDRFGGMQVHNLKMTMAQKGRGVHLRMPDLRGLSPQQARRYSMKSQGVAEDFPVVCVGGAVSGLDTYI